MSGQKDVNKQPPAEDMRKTDGGYVQHDGLPGTHGQLDQELLQAALIKYYY